MDSRKVPVQGPLGDNRANFGAIRGGMGSTNRETSFRNTGAVEQDRPKHETNAAPLTEQLDHQFQDPLNKANDSGMNNRGQTPDFNQNENKDDDLAA